MPPLPTDWRVVGPGLPSRFGHSIEIVLEAGAGACPCSRLASFGVIAPTLARSATGTTAYWQSGERVYALTGSAPEAAIERAAASLNASLR